MSEIKMSDFPSLTGNDLGDSDTFPVIKNGTNRKINWYNLLWKVLTNSRNETNVKTYSCHYINNNLFKVLTGSIIPPAKNNENTTGSTTINYPTGFNKDNTVVISVMSKRYNGDGFATSMSSSLSASETKGNGDTRVTLLEDYILVETEKNQTSDISYQRNFKIVISKIS